MKKFLLAYKIDGKVINKEIFNWSSSDLNGNQPWLVSDDIRNDYYNISSIENWDVYSSYIEKDYLFIRNQIKLIYDESYLDKEGNTIRFSDYVGEEDEKILSKYFLVDKTTRDKYYSDTEQEYFWTVLVNKSQECRKIRWEKAKTYISFNLSAQNSSDLAISTSELCNNYINYNIISKSKDGVSGLFDYLRGIEDYYTNGYPSKSYWSQQDQDRLLDILENGNY